MKTVELLVGSVFFTLTGIWSGRLFDSTRRPGSKGWNGFPRGLTILMSGLGVIVAIASACVTIFLFATSPAS
jgi:hypothetical protein